MIRYAIREIQAHSTRPLHKVHTEALTLIEASDSATIRLRFTIEIPFTFSKVIYL